MQSFRALARVTQRASIAAARAQMTVAPLRTLTVSAVRCSAIDADKARVLAAARAASQKEFVKSTPTWPADLPMRTDENGVQWADFRPENLRNAAPVRNEDGDLVGRFDGEDVIFPDLEPTLEWVLTTPVELHLFEEAPILKCYQEEEADFIDNPSH